MSDQTPESHPENHPENNTEAPGVSAPATDPLPGHDDAVLPSFGPLASAAPVEALEAEQHAVEVVEVAAVEHAQVLGEPLPGDPDNPAADLLPDQQPEPRADDLGPVLGSMISSVPAPGLQPPAV